MSTVKVYYNRITEIMEEVFSKEGEAMEKAAAVLADARFLHSVVTMRV